VLSWVVVGALVVAFALSIRRDPRTLRTGFFLFGALGLSALLVLVEVVSAVERSHPTAAGWIVLALLLIGLLVVVILGALLVFAGITLLRKERGSLPNQLALLTGALLLGYVILGVVAVATGRRIVVDLLVMVGFPAFYLGFGLVTFIGYGWVYRFVTSAHRPVVDAVVVLGAGLRGTAVTPLLARRLDRGHAVYRRSLAAGRRPVIVVSGGQGPDEVVSEAEAMAEYLLRQGVPPATVLREDRSTNTRENLEFSSKLLRSRGIAGPVAVATSDYHVLRAAMLMRHWGIDGFTVGSATPAYFWPSATIREYVAVLRDHLWLNLLGMMVFCAPVLVLAVRALAA
jgi:uncharacterized SAM-binding protein YcdF (DUF218 family)